MASAAQKSERHPGQGASRNQQNLEGVNFCPTSNERDRAGQALPRQDRQNQPQWVKTQAAAREVAALVQRGALSQRAGLVWAALATNLNDWDATTFVSADTIGATVCRKGGYDPRTVRRALDELRAKDLIAEVAGGSGFAVRRMLRAPDGAWACTSGQPCKWAVGYRAAWDEANPPPTPDILAGPPDSTAPSEVHPSEECKDTTATPTPDIRKRRQVIPSRQHPLPLPKTPAMTKPPQGRPTPRTAPWAKPEGRGGYSTPTVTPAATPDQKARYAEHQRAWRQLALLPAPPDTSDEPLTPEELRELVSAIGGPRGTPC